MNHWGGLKWAVPRRVAYDVMCDTCDRKIAYADWLSDAYEAWRLHTENRCEFHPRARAAMTVNDARLCRLCVQYAMDLYHETMGPPEEEWEEREE